MGRLQATGHRWAGQSVARLNQISSAAHRPMPLQSMKPPSQPRLAGCLMTMPDANPPWQPTGARLIVKPAYRRQGPMTQFLPFFQQRWWPVPDPGPPGWVGRQAGGSDAPPCGLVCPGDRTCVRRAVRRRQRFVFGFLRTEPVVGIFATRLARPIRDRIRDLRAGQRRWFKGP